MIKPTENNHLNDSIVISVGWKHSSPLNKQNLHRFIVSLLSERFGPNLLWVWAGGRGEVLVTISGYTQMARPEIISFELISSTGVN